MSDLRVATERSIRAAYLFVGLRVLLLCRERSARQGAFSQALGSSEARRRIASFVRAPLSLLEARVGKWDAKYIDVSFRVLVQILRAAKYMDIPSLFDLACAKIAIETRGRSLGDAVSLVQACYGSGCSFSSVLPLLPFFRGTCTCLTRSMELYREICA